MDQSQIAAFTAIAAYALSECLNYPPILYIFNCFPLAFHDCLLPMSNNQMSVGAPHMSVDGYAKRFV